MIAKTKIANGLLTAAKAARGRRPRAGHRMDRHDGSRTARPQRPRLPPPRVRAREGRPPGQARPGSGARTQAFGLGDPQHCRSGSH